MSKTLQAGTNPHDRPVFLKCYDKEGKRIAPLMSKQTEPTIASKPVAHDPERMRRMQKLLFERIRREVEAGTLESRIAALRERSRIAEQQDKDRRSDRMIRI